MIMHLNLNTTEAAEIIAKHFKIQPNQVSINPDYLSKSLDEGFLQSLDGPSKLDAIKKLREYTGCGLRECKDFVYEFHPKYQQMLREAQRDQIF